MRRKPLVSDVVLNKEKLELAFQSSGAGDRRQNLDRAADLFPQRADAGEEINRRADLYAPGRHVPRKIDNVAVTASLDHAATAGADVTAGRSMSAGHTASAGQLLANHASAASYFLTVKEAR